MAEVQPLGKIKSGVFQDLSRSDRTTCIKNWLMEEMQKPIARGLHTFLLEDVRTGHEDKHYDVDKPIKEKNYNELEERIYWGDEEPVPYQLTDKEMSDVAERAMREIKDVTLFSDGGMATMAMFTAIDQEAEKVGEHLVWGGWNPTPFSAELSPVYCGSGMHFQPSGTKLGEMFPELSSQHAVVILQKEKHGTHFFHINTAYVDLTAESVVPTGRFMDKAMEKVLQTEMVPGFIRGYWNLSLSGFVMSPYRDPYTQQITSMSCEFSYKGDKYQIRIYENSYEQRYPTVKKQINGKWQNVNFKDLPETVQSESRKMDYITRTGVKELTSIRDGILRDPEELTRDSQNRDDIIQE